MTDRELVARRRLVVLAVVLAAAAAVGLWPMSDWRPLATGIPVAPWMLVGAFVAAEIFVVHLRFGRHNVSFSLSEVPLTLSFAVLSPAHAVAYRLVASVIALSSQRVRGIKLWFNVASYALEVTAATAVYRLVLGDHHPLDPRGWVAALAAAAAVDLLSGATITAAMSIHQGRYDRSDLAEVIVTGLVASSTNSCLAVVTLIVLDFDPRASIALAVIGAVLIVAYRAWARQARRFDDLEAVYALTRQLESVADLDELAQRSLPHLHDVTGCRMIELRLDSADGDVTRTWTYAVDEQPPLRVVEQQALQPAPDVAWRADGSVDEDRVAVPIRATRISYGHIAMRGHLDDVSVFGAADRTLLETVANHLAVAIDNNELLGRLRDEISDKEYQANHDALTGLANRGKFATTVDEMIGRSAAGPAVLVLDLDRFKDVNDTLGHSAGDAVLIAVAQRLTDEFPPGTSIARLGGDEFAVALSVETTDAAVAGARRVLRVLADPVCVDDVEVDVAASVGVAIGGIHGRDAESLLRQADIAMYDAKEQQNGIETYSFERDVNDVRRLRLLSELRAAIAQRRLVVHYQPQIEIRTGRLIGVEALVRWTSEQYGPVPPDEFIQLAECTGQINALTACVMDAALDDHARWCTLGWSGSVSINISPRSLADPVFGERITTALALHGVAPSTVTLEITETSLMRDVERNIAHLRTLADLGVRLAIDDFGTGYSSLAYLKRLPVHELKIDRSFTRHLDTDESDRSIVRATTTLAHDLGLHIVAEGVETADVLDLLASWDVDIAQGYYFSRPVPASDIERRILATRQSEQRHAAT